jgi:hypothetical protein
VKYIYITLQGQSEKMLQFKMLTVTWRLGRMCRCQWKLPESLFDEMVYMLEPVFIVKTLMDAYTHRNSQRGVLFQLQQLLVQFSLLI